MYKYDTVFEPTRPSIHSPLLIMGFRVRVRVRVDLTVQEGNTDLLCVRAEPGRENPDLIATYDAG